MAKIKNGNCISIIQQSFIDARFVDFKVISLGGDNVLLHPCVECDVMVLFNSAADLIGNILMIVDLGRRMSRYHMKGVLG